MNVNSDISVVIITYNQSDLISDAIESVLNQTLYPEEIIVADDGSTDETPEIVRDYAERYPDLVEAILHDENQGIAANVNSGLKAASGNLITLLAGDDRFLPEKLEVEIEQYRKATDANIVFSDTYVTHGDGSHIGRWYGNQAPPTGDVFKHVFARDFWFRGWLQDDTTIEKVGYWDEDLGLYSDWDYTIRLTRQFDVTYTSRPLQEYRKHDESVTSSLDRERSLQYIEEVYEKNRPLLNDLSSEDRKYIEQSLQNYILRQRALIDRDQGNFLNAMRRYMGLLAQDPREITNFRSHAKLVLPEQARLLLRNRL